MTDQDLLEPTAAFAELGLIKLGETDLSGVLQKVSELARRTLPGADAVSVTLIPGSGAHTAAFAGEVAVALDEFQYERGAGPCVTAAGSIDTLSVPDMNVEPRWPEWAARALALGVNSSLAVGLPVHQAVSGALNVYARKPQAFDDDAIILARSFAGYAAVALANAHLYDVAATLTQHLQSAMASRAVIEQAKGIIMGERRCSAEEAFRILTRLSQDTNRKVRDIAVALVDRAAPVQKH